MGFDLSGINPTVNKEFPTRYNEILKQYGKDGYLDWNKEIPEKVKNEYFQLQDEYQSNNPGDYFRANVWWWRPLWDYVCHVCDDILIEEDMEKGTYNDGHEIDNEKALAIADRLKTLHKNGDMLKHQIEREAYLKGLDKIDCTTCNGTGQRNDEYVKGDCNGCNGEGKRESWETSYPFETDFVMDFAKFCEQSGGFSIC